MPLKLKLNNGVIKHHCHKKKKNVSKIVEENKWNNKKCIVMSKNKAKLSDKISEICSLKGKQIHI